ncbi:hypothetical protein L1987_10709 [Smallanthus sonchifolius]|uniref:Uncharacterized protein n=1 Tax=Smallanthus sonchifolius TaxID=185202 RepID=A0ACB9J8U9_9ASTR|nr:hypothetical protein L1987_10709 [Smallanthus sonchifolius]
MGLMLYFFSADDNLKLSGLSIAQMGRSLKMVWTLEGLQNLGDGPDDRYKINKHLAKVGDQSSPILYDSIVLIADSLLCDVLLDCYVSVFRERRMRYGCSLV